MVTRLNPALVAVATSAPFRGRSATRVVQHRDVAGFEYLPE
jgi:hypothetical protein